MQIRELMRVRPEDHDLEWLKRSLQAALELEFSTIPPYLTAYWSIKRSSDPSARSIREVFVEEMLHLGICCNLLAAIGGQPVLNTADVIPRYPGPLPGGVHPGLEVALEGLNRGTLQLFMEIEYPEGGPVALRETFPTIGEFYDALDQAFATLAPTITTDRQITTFWMPALQNKFETVADARAAIALIKVQGEGSNASPEEADGDLAHYYRFGEIYNGRRLQKNPDTGKWAFDGPPVPFPDAWPVARVPAGGYTQARVTPEVWALLDQFDNEFTAMMHTLHEAWATPSADRLDDAINAMFGLSGPALELMTIPIPNGTGTYAPCFRFKV
jgi:hypothetical protein